MVPLSRKSIPLLIAALLIVALAIPTLAAPAAQDADQTIAEIAAADEQFSVLVSAIEAANLGDTLASDGPFTVFAPTNDAFAALDEAMLDGLLADPEGALTDVLLYHVLSGKVMAGEVAALDGQTVDTLGGPPLLVTVADDGSVMINEATITVADIEASNGVIHVIDAVLVPAVDTATGDGEEAATDDEVVAEDAEAAVEGEDAAMAESEEVAMMDDEAAQADIAEIRGLFEQAAAALPALVDEARGEAEAAPGETEAAPGEAEAAPGEAEAAPEETEAAPEETEAETASCQSFVYIEELIIQSGMLNQILDHDYPLTIFAPVDCAFEELSPEELDELLSMPSGQMRNVLRYHMMASHVPAKQVAEADGEELNTMAGEPIEVNIVGDKIDLNGQATVIRGDAIVEPGLIVHAIDGLLFPLDDDKYETFYEEWRYGGYANGYWKHHYPYYVKYHKPMHYGYGKCCKHY